MKKYKNAPLVVSLIARDREKGASPLTESGPRYPSSVQGASPLTESCPWCPAGHVPCGL